MRYQNIIFDLDGTLINSAAGVTGGVKYAAAKMNFPIPTEEALRTCIGPPLMSSFKRLFGLEGEPAAEMLDWYREYYTPIGKYECSLYDGIEALLKTLLNKGYRLFVATLKYDKSAAEILKYFDIAKYFTRVAGALEAGFGDDKSEVINRAIDGFDGNCVMVGDSVYDMEGANALGMDAIAVTYGFGSLDEMQKHNPAYVAGSVDDILKILT